MGKPVFFYMDMSAEDFLALLYLLNVPIEVINLKGILVSPNGWATAATIDFVYDMLHMVERDDIQVGLASVFAVGQSYSSVTLTSLGDCSYSKSIPYGSGGYLDSDTLYGFAQDLSRSPRSGSPGLGQPTTLDVWNSIVKSLHPGSKITLLTNGPLTNFAEIILSENYTDSVIQQV